MRENTVSLWRHAAVFRFFAAPVAASCFLRHIFVFYKFFLCFYWIFPHPAFHNVPRQNVNFAVIFR